METELETTKITYTQSDSGVLEFRLEGDDTRAVSSYDYLAYISENYSTDESVKALWNWLDSIEANRIIKDETYWELRHCVMVKIIVEDENRLRRLRHNEKSQKTYLMKDLKTGYIKIGYSTNPRFREKTLQAEQPRIVLLKVCDENVERLLHKQYADKRKRGEWFNLSKEDIQTIIETYNFHDYE